MKTLAALLLLIAADYTTIDGVLHELYASVTRAPGQPFDWDRFRAATLPGAILVPMPREVNGETKVISVDELIAWSNERWKPIIGTEKDRGFYEKQINLVVQRYGDIAHAFSSYEEGYVQPPRVLNRGVNSIQLVWRNGRWWIASITWDEGVK